MKKYAENARNVRELSRSEFADELRISYTTVRRWVSEGKFIPEDAVRQDDMGRYWIHESAVEEVKSKLRERLENTRIDSTF